MSSRRPDNAPKPVPCASFRPSPIRWNLCQEPVSAPPVAEKKPMEEMSIEELNAEIDSLHVEYWGGEDNYKLYEQLKKEHRQFFDNSTGDGRRGDDYELAKENWPGKAGFWPPEDNSPTLNAIRKNLRDLYKLRNNKLLAKSAAR